MLILQMRSITKRKTKRLHKPDTTGYAALNVAGKRVTSQRALILEIIRWESGHLDADEIYRRARVQRPRLSLSTVYRTLQALKEAGLIEELRFDDTHHHYEVKSSSKHHHLVCLSCGKVIEFEYPMSRFVKKNIAEAKGFEIVATEINMTGYCAECQKKKK